MPVRCVVYPGQQPHRQVRLQEDVRATRDARHDHMLMSLYDFRWNEFVELTTAGKEFSFNDVPWLPDLQRKTDDGQESFEVIGVHEDSSIADKKSAVRQAALRWHPDKFTQVRWHACETRCPC
jgi:hypothetical protein